MRLSWYCFSIVSCSSVAYSKPRVRADLHTLTSSPAPVGTYWFSAAVGPLKTTIKQELGINNAQYGVVSPGELARASLTKLILVEPLPSSRRPIIWSTLSSPSSPASSSITTAARAAPSSPAVSDFADFATTLPDAPSPPLSDHPHRRPAQRWRSSSFSLWLACGGRGHRRLRLHHHPDGADQAA